MHIGIRKSCRRITCGLYKSWWRIADGRQWCSGITYAELLVLGTHLFEEILPGIYHIVGDKKKYVEESLTARNKPWWRNTNWQI